MDTEMEPPASGLFPAIAALLPRLPHSFKLRLPDRQSPGYYEEMLRLDPGAESLMKVL